MEKGHRQGEREWVCLTGIACQEGFQVENVRNMKADFDSGSVQGAYGHRGQRGREKSEEAVVNKATCVAILSQ